MLHLSQRMREKGRSVSDYVHAGSEDDTVFMGRSLVQSKDPFWRLLEKGSKLGRYFE